MKSLFLAAIFAVLLAGCASTSPHAGNPAGQSAATSTFGPYLADGVRSGSSASQGPQITVGTRYPDERLILPWFLDSAIDAANAR